MVSLSPLTMGMVVNGGGGFYVPGDYIELFLNTLCPGAATGAHLTGGVKNN